MNTENPLPDYHEVIRASALQPGDYVYRTLPLRMTGPRGGRYRIRPVSIMARVRSFDSRTGTLHLADAGKTGWPLRLRYDVDVIIKRRETAGGSVLPSSAALLESAVQAEVLGQMAEAARLFAEAERASAEGR